MFINVHTHHPTIATNDSFSLPNVILSKDPFLTTPCSIGIHPWYIEENVDQQFQELGYYLSKNNVLAIGECGLDKISRTAWPLQRTVFEKQIQLATQYQKPLIVHCVRAYSEVIALLKKNQTTVPVLFHGYIKSADLAASLLKEGYYLSLGASILRGKNDALIQQLPLDRIFLETDDQEIKISEIYTYFCRVRKIYTGYLQEQLMLNFKTVFNYSIR